MSSLSVMSGSVQCWVWPVSGLGWGVLVVWGGVFG